MGVRAMINGSMDLIREMPGIRHWRRRGWERRFANATGEVNHWRGVYGSFEEALAHVPAARRVGYDNDASASLYGTRFTPLLKDYPAMFWLQRAMDEGSRRLFDLGGHVGMKHYAFEPHLRLPEDLRWTVCDVPAVVRRGQDLAAQRGASPRLAFTDRWEDMGDADLLFASGSLQYLPLTLAEMLARLPRPPRWLVINTTPLHPTRAFFTVNGTGTAFCPYRIGREDEFIRSLQDSGYTLLDRWQTPKHFRIPFHAEHDMNHYVGMALRRTGD